MLHLKNGAGLGQPNDDEDVAHLADKLEEIGVFERPAFAGGGPLTTISEAMVDGMKQVQREAKIDVDGYALAGGPTERAINNRLFAKPRGAFLYADPAAQVANPVGNGFVNDFADVKRVRRLLGAGGYLEEHPADDPSGFFDRDVREALLKYQNERQLRANGRVHPRDETEAELGRDALAMLRRHNDNFAAYYDRAAAAGDPDAIQVKSRRAAREIGREDGAERPQARQFAEVGESDFGDAEAPIIRGEGSKEQNKYEPRATLEPTDDDNFLRIAELERDEGGKPSTPPSGRSEEKQPERAAPDLPIDPYSNFGSWALKRESLLPEGVTPPDDPLKPDQLGNLPTEWGDDMSRPGQMPTDLGVSRKTEVRYLFSRLYRVGAVDEQGRHRLSDEDFAKYLEVAGEHIKPEHFAVFEMTARAVRARVLDWHTAATRLAMYYAPQSTGEQAVDLVLDLTPLVGQVKAAREAVEAIQDAIDADAYGDDKARDLAVGRAAAALGVLAAPGALAGVARLLRPYAYYLQTQLHHLIPLNLGGDKSGPTVALTAFVHQLVLHRRMRRYFDKVEPGLVPKRGYPGTVIQDKFKIDARLKRIDEFYRSQKGSWFTNKVYEEWIRIFPEAWKHFRR